MRTFLCYIVILLLCYGCRQDDPVGPQPNDGSRGGGSGSDSLTYDEGVYVLNEGNFQSGNASVTFYHRQKDTVVHQLFATVNDQPLGDVLQSMTIRQGQGYLVVNNSQKAEVVDLASFRQEATITGFTSPRYMHIVNSGKAYVTDLYADKTAVVDLNAYSVTDQIPVTGWTEQLVEHNGQVFITNMDSAQVVVVDANSDQVTARIPVVTQPNSIVKDQNNMLWVLCDGGFGAEKPALIQIDPDSLQKNKTLTFNDINDNPGELTINESGDRLFYLNGGIYEVSTTAATLPAQPLVAKQSHNFYGLGYDPVDDALYVSDALDYSQKGWVYRYTLSGQPADSFRAGINPGAFAFR